MKEKEQNEKKTPKKGSKKLQIIVCTLIVVLIAMIAIFGIYTQYQNRMVNKVKGYSYGMDLKGERSIILTPSAGTDDVIKDSEGNEVTDADNLTDEELAEKGYTKESVAVNSEEKLTAENYQKSKEVIEKRLKQLDVEQYNINVNEQTGEITINIPEDSRTDDIINEIIPVGKFEIVDSETKEVLMTNSDVKEAKVMYGQSSVTQNATNVYLDIQFNKDGKKKFEDVTNAYKTIEEQNDTSDQNSTDNATAAENSTTENTTSVEGETAENNTTENTTNDTTAETDENTTEETQKQVTIMLDGEEMLTTSFDDVVKTGEMSLVVGSAATEEDQIQDYATNALNMATIISNGEMPVEYEGVSQYILSDITREALHIIEIIIVVAIVLGLLILVIRYKTNGFLASIGYVGLAAIFALIIRYTNVIVALEGIFAIAIILIINYIFQNKLLLKIKKLKEENEDEVVKKAMKDTFKDFFIKIIPICIMAITFSFIKWIPISSFGMIMFWGLLLIAVYNPIITFYLLRIKNK